MRKPNVTFGKDYALWYGLPGYALEIEHEPPFGWRVSMFRPIPVSRILRTTVYVDEPNIKNLRDVVRKGMAMILAWGGDEAVCNGLPPNMTVCYTR